MALPEGHQLGPYEILAPLGAGGMGEVYLARDTRLGREVAVKVLPAGVSSDPDRLKRFEREARSASSLSHPSIVTIYDVGESNGISFIAMEKVDGRTLREVLAEGALPTKKFLSIAAQVADGLAKAHGAGIVHRDLKPENLMVTKDGFAKILDFGLAKLTQGDGSSGASQIATLSAGTEPGVVMGTVGYMSPEQALGKPLDFRSDQFSFGSILYEMATGKRAFARKNAPETLTAIIREEPEPIRIAAPETSVPLSWFVERCLAKDPEDRYAATRDLARDLARLRDSFSLSSHSEFPSVALPARSRSRRWIPRVGAALAAAAVILFAATWRRTEEPPTFRALTFRRGSLSGARFGPDGQTVIYAAAWQGKPMQLYSTRADSTVSTTLPLASGDLLAISATGKMAIRINHGTAPPIVAEVSLAGGEPRELLEGSLDADYSPTGDRMAITRGGKLEYPVGTVLYDPGADKSIYVPRVSPDGRWIAFIEESGNRAEIALVDLAGKKRTLSAGWETTTSLAWHPLTGEVWFSARAFASSGVVNLHAVSLSGRHRVVARGPLLLIIQDIARDGRILARADDWTETMMCLAPGAASESDLTWLDDSAVADLSSDGQELLFTEEGIAEGANKAVYLRRTDGSPAVRLGEGRAYALSPDKKWVLASQKLGLALLPTGPGEPRSIPSPGLDPMNGSWCPDGKRIVYVAASRGSRPRIYVQDLAGGVPRPITPEGFIGHRAVSPDGKFVAAQSQERGAFLFPLDGGEPRPLPGIASSEVILRFDTAGTDLFLESGSLPLKVFRYHIASGHREPWREIVIADPVGFVTFNRLVLTPDGRSYAHMFFRIISRLYVIEGLR